jgi:amino-acid N-acetyltransferase
LTTSALDLAGRRGVGVVYLLTKTAIDYFPRFGFTPIARHDVPPGVLSSVEFRAECCASAVVMRRALDAPSR